MKNIRIKLLERKIKRITRKLYKKRVRNHREEYKYRRDTRILFAIQRHGLYSKLNKLKEG